LFFLSILPFVHVRLVVILGTAILLTSLNPVSPMLDRTPSWFNRLLYLEGEKGEWKNHLLFQRMLEEKNEKDSTYCSRDRCPSDDHPSVSLTSSSVYLPRFQTI